jgi:MFS family permease
VAAVIWAASLLSLAIAVLTNATGGTDAASILAATLAVISSVTVGAVLVTRLPNNLIGWVLLLSGFLLALSLGLGGLATYGLDLHPGSVPGAIWIAWLSGLTWMPFSVGLAFYLPLLFPSGHLPSARWRPVAFLGIIAVACSTVRNALSPFAPGTFPPVDRNPLAIGGALGGVISLLGAASNLIGVVALPLVAASLVIRSRRASGVERQQLKWLASVVAIVGPALVLAIVFGQDANGVGTLIGNVAWLIVLAGFGLAPIAIGLAVLRYRLYEIDRVIRRTIVYGILASFLAAAYGGSVVALSEALNGLTSSNSLAIAGSTLLVAGLFNPIRTRISASVDRQFYRSRYDAERELDAFGARLRGAAELDGLSDEIAATVLRTLQPTSARIWLRDEPDGKID